MKLFSILREGSPENYKHGFEVVLGNYLNEGYKIEVALLDSKDKLVVLLTKEEK